MKLFVIPIDKLVMNTYKIISIGLPSTISQGNHIRTNPLTGEIVQVSTERLQRAWGVLINPTSEGSIPEYLETCPFCPGNTRQKGDPNPDNLALYPFAFRNDVPALRPPATNHSPVSYEAGNGLFQATESLGVCEVITHHPLHNLTLGTMPFEHAVKVIQLWQKRYQDLGALDFIRAVNIFENFLFGSSQRHPHNQLWATSYIPEKLQRILVNVSKYNQQHRALLMDKLVNEELAFDQRVVIENDSFVGFVPFWAKWPFEMMIAPRQAKNSLLDLNIAELKDLTRAYRSAIRLLNTLFKTDACPYTAHLIQQPTEPDTPETGLFHLNFVPPVLRDVQTYKWMVGFEIMANPQRDLTPEAAAYLLRNPEGWKEFRQQHMADHSKPQG